MNVEIGIRLIIQIFNNNSLVNTLVSLTIQDNNNNLDIYDANGKIINSAQTNTGLFEVYINPKNIQPLTVKITHNGQQYSQNITPQQITSTEVIIFNIGTQNNNGTIKTVEGTFREYPFDQDIQKIKGDITFNFKHNNVVHNVKITSLIQQDNIYTSNYPQFIQIINSSLSWSGRFDKGTFIFNIFGTTHDLTDCFVEINYDGTIYGHNAYWITHSSPQNNFNLTNNNPIQRVIIPVNHPVNNYIVNDIKLIRINNNQLINTNYSIRISFIHKYTDILGNVYAFKYNNKGLISINNQLQLEGDIINYNLVQNAGRYNINFSDILGELIDIKIDINYQGWKTHINVANGVTQQKFNLTQTHNTQNIIIPLNGWQGNFTIMPIKNEGQVYYINYQKTIMPYKEFTLNNNTIADDLNFEINCQELTYNNSKTNTGFLINVYVSDSQGNPIMVHLNRGTGSTLDESTTRNLIHSLDFHSSNDFYINNLFLMVPMTPVPINLIEQRDNILLNPVNKHSTINMSINFINNNNANLTGDFYVIAEAVPVHFIGNGNDKTIDSIGQPMRGLYIIHI